MNTSSIGDIIIEMLETLNAKKGSLDSATLQDLLTEQTLRAVKAMGQGGGITIDVDPIIEGEESKASVPPREQGGFTNVRNQINETCRKIASAAGAETLGVLLTTPIRDLVALDEHDKATVSMCRALGETLGEVAERTFKIPALGPLCGRLGEVLGAAGCRLCTNSRVLAETQLAKENLQILLEFGVRHDQLQALAFDYFARIAEADRDIAASVAANQRLKANFQTSLAQASANTDAALAASARRMEQGLAEFHNDMAAVLGKL